jgi:hypothetical protein
MKRATLLQCILFCLIFVSACRRDEGLTIPRPEPETTPTNPIPVLDSRWEGSWTANLEGQALLMHIPAEELREDFDKFPFRPRVLISAQSLIIVDASQTNRHIDEFPRVLSSTGEDPQYRDLDRPGWTTSLSLFGTNGLLLNFSGRNPLGQFLYTKDLN